MDNPNQFTRQQVIEQLAAQLDRPIAIKEFTQQVLAIWHSNAKKPETGVRQAIRDDYLGKVFLFLDNKTIVPTRVALKGVRLRVPLSDEERETHCIRFMPAFSHIVKEEYAFREPDEEDITLVAANGRSLITKFITQSKEVETPFGTHTVKRLTVDLSNWRPIYDAQPGDSIIITILDWENGRYQIELEPASQRQLQAEAIAQRNQMLADNLYADLEMSRYEKTWGQKAVPTALIRLPQDDIIPDHWLWVMKEDGRMEWSMREIGYISEFSIMDIFFGDAAGTEDEEEEDEEIELSAAEKQQVYRFKAYLKHRKGLWRRIEIQGEQTLDALDRMLRTAFNHDDSDHLGGFWLLIPRGKGRRLREIEIATIYPFGGDGFGDDTPIAALELEPGAKLKYVYDFGDWIDHRLELEAIDAPEPAAKYPRQTAQNRPRYRYCPVCKERGKKEIAAWICIDCSNAEQRDVLVCEACIEEFHPDHYADEILY